MPTFFTQQTAARLRNDHLAKTLLQNGNRFGRQHVVFQSKHAYPAYVVRYRMVRYASAVQNIVTVQSSTKTISVTVAGKYVYKKHPRTSGHLFVLVVVSVDTLKVVSTTVFNIHEVAGAKGMNQFISNLDHCRSNVDHRQQFRVPGTNLDQFMVLRYNLEPITYNWDSFESK